MTKELPPLPEPDRVHNVQFADDIELFTADQMRAYARASLAAQPVAPDVEKAIVLLEEGIKLDREGWTFGLRKKANDALEALSPERSALAHGGFIVAPSPEASNPVQAEAPVVECDCVTAISPNGSRVTRCGSDQMRRAVSDGHAFATPGAVEREAGNAAERKRFEALFHRFDLRPCVTRVGHYNELRVQFMWESWQARAALATQPLEQKPVAWANADELDNMLDDRTATVASAESGLRRVALYLGPQPEQAAQDSDKKGGA